jgi:hypothetical protein
VPLSLRRLCWLCCCQGWLDFVRLVHGCQHWNPHTTHGRAGLAVLYTFQSLTLVLVAIKCGCNSPRTQHLTRTVSTALLSNSVSVLNNRRSSPANSHEAFCYSETGCLASVVQSASLHLLANIGVLPGQTLHQACKVTHFTLLFVCTALSSRQHRLPRSMQWL